jgi:hypothetical protein
MPAGGLLFANDHKAGRTVVMDLRDPLHPHVHALFGDLNGFSHPHLFMLKFDPDTGALAIDSAFHDNRGNPGFDFDNRTWPHGWTGSAIAHGVVFSN